MNITIMLPAGRLPLDVMARAYALAEKYGLGVYLSTAQNLRLINVAEEDAEAVKAELLPLGLQFKGPGKFPLPRVCVGKPHCNLNWSDWSDWSNWSYWSNWSDWSNWSCWSDWSNGIAETPLSRARPAPTAKFILPRSLSDFQNAKFITC